MENKERYIPLLAYDLQRFAKEGPGGEKTEPATQKKLDDARKDGKVAKSKELTSAVELLGLFLVMKLFMSYVANGLLNLFAYFYNKIPDLLLDNHGGFTYKSSNLLASEACLKIIIISLPFFGMGIAVAIGINVFMMKGILFTTKPLKPDLKKFSPANGIKKIISKDSLFELVKSFLKLGVIALVAYVVLKDEIGKIFLLYDIELEQAVILVGQVIINTGLAIAAVYLIVGLVDWIYQYRKFNNDMKMTKQEVKDEMKNTEGDPQIKGRQRQRMREASQRRMMSDVPSADVIITNPTHIAVALKYDDSVSRAPIVVAKGEDYLATKIKEVGKENNVEIVENKPLARMLYTNVEIGAEIPPELYQAVAEILAVIYKTKNRI
ncbi:MAG: flagellar biosynthesis protein FlhB [Eubacterium sp.]|nr:flagellar biosynthesis protein FlhB [Eubacterium sp.]